MTNPIERRALGPPLLQDYLDFFEGVEFRDHPDWSACYCHSFHFTGSAEQWTKENNRNAVIRLIERIEQDYRTMGYDWLEAYPGKGSRSQEEHYTGPPSMFLSRGYHIFRESEDYYLVRKSLR